MQKVGFEEYSSQPDKIEYIALQKSNDKMSASEKKGVEQWNLMVNKLRKHNLMEDKK